MTHCGWGSITEAITTKTPLICIPAFADQPMNAKLLANKKIGVVVFDSDNFRIPEQYDVEISEERFYNGITAVFEDETYYKAIERLNKMSSYNNAADNICNVIKQALEFGHAHLFNPLFENANVKTGAPLSKILKPEFLPPNAQ
jgi:UDP:flavonoid glycosyltransferase YjiC (YdhE family)